MFSTPILYEPDDFEGKTLGKPVDFVIQKDGITFWIQIKNLSWTERQNRQSETFKKLQKLLEAIKVNKFVNCFLSEDFKPSDIEPLVKFISTVAAGSIEDEKYLYPSKDHIKAEIIFLEPKNSTLEYLKLGEYGYLNWVNVTGESRIHIRESLNKATEAFTWDTDNKNINLIAMEMCDISHHNIDLDEAVFGDESSLYSIIKSGQLLRASNGFFNDSHFSSKVAGVIELKRKGSLPLSRYTKNLFVNERFKDMIDQIKLLIDFDKVIHFNELIFDNET